MHPSTGVEFVRRHIPEVAGVDVGQNVGKHIAGKLDLRPFITARQALTSGKLVAELVEPTSELIHRGDNIPGAGSSVRRVLAILSVGLSPRLP